MESINQKAGAILHPAYYNKDAKSIKRQLEIEIFNNEKDTYKAHKKAAQTKVLLKAGKAQTAGDVELSNGKTIKRIAHGVKSIKITAKVKQKRQNEAQYMHQRFMNEAREHKIRELQDSYYKLSSRQKKKVGSIQNYIKANL